ncbi:MULTISPECIES: ABC transporter permease [Clostridium]|nr:MULTISPECIES: FtsX-like permease family protein [Clostridium]MBW9159404.1 FtsX-like permease family protein [Clostridium tagluense]MBZ9637575.1 FtsX-like permease family protein [Clostridium sp. FP1]WLC68122.1 FtsX-like permease family protein [Clostridium tagluense]
MKSFWGLIPRSLIKNKKRTLFISISILLSAMLITSLSLTLSNYKEQKIENGKKQSGGHYYASCTEAGNFESIKTLKSEPLIDKFGTTILMGYAKTFDTDNKIELNGYDKIDRELLDFRLEQGRFPEKDSEVALEKWVLNKFKDKLKIGDKVNLNYIFNYIKFKGDKELPGVKIGEKQFILTGILENRLDSMRDKKAKGYLTIDSVKNTLTQDEYRYIHHFTLKPSADIKETLTSMGKIQGVSISENYSYISTLNSAQKANMIFFSLGIIIIISAISVIYNIYSISVVERIHEFGILRAIGADTKQIKKLMFGEGIILGCIFIPLGILLSLISMNQINKLFNFSTNLKSSSGVPFSGILISFIVCFIAIFISIYFPTKKAAKVSPMEAINNTSIQGEQLENPMGKKKIRVFGKFTTGMAYTNLTRNKKRFLATVISLSISIVLFITVTSFCVWVDPVKNVDADINSDYILTASDSEKNAGYDRNVVCEILDIQGITSVNKSLYFRASLDILGDKITEAYKEKLNKVSLQNNRDDSNTKSNIYNVPIELYGCNDEELKKMSKYLDDGKLDIEDMKNTSKVVLVQNFSNNKSTNLIISDELNIKSAMKENGTWNQYNKKVSIGAVLNKLPFPTMDRGINIVVIIHEDVLKNWLKEDKYKVLRINTKKDLDENYVKKRLNEYAKDQKEGKLISYKDQLEFYKDAQRSISVILYSFVIIIAIIGIINIINTISMNIILRRQEFGMIRAIGMGKDEISSMILKEGLLYGVFSSILGSIMGFVLHVILYNAIKYDMAVQWFFPWKSILEVFLASMFMCVLASIGPLKRLLSTSIIDSIRNVD